MQTLEQKILIDSKQELKNRYEERVNRGAFLSKTINKKVVINRFQSRFGMAGVVSIPALLKFVGELYVEMHLEETFNKNLDTFYKNAKNNNNNK